MLLLPQRTTRSDILCPSTNVVRSISACRLAIGFDRAGALHGLGLGLDSSPAIVSGIPVAAFLSDSANSYFGASPPRIREEPSRKRHGAPALYSCRSEEHTSELQVTNAHLVCRLLLEKKNHRPARMRRLTANGRHNI